MRTTRPLLLLALALSACGSEPPDAPDADPDAPGVQRAGRPRDPAAIAIPEDFPLSDGMAERGRATTSASPPQSVGMRALDFCGRKPLRGAGADRPARGRGQRPRVLQHPRPDALRRRRASRAAVLADIRAAAAACPVEAPGPGSRAADRGARLDLRAGRRHRGPHLRAGRRRRHRRRDHRGRPGRPRPAGDVVVRRVGSRPPTSTRASPTRRRSGRWTRWRVGRR